MVAIVVPVYNDPEGVQTTLKSIRPQFKDVEAHLYAVDNNSTDETPNIIDEYSGERITHLTETAIQSSYAARNTGIRNTDSDILAFVDADMTVPENWLESALQTFHSTDADYMGCDVELTLPETSTLTARYDAHTGFPVEQYIKHQQFTPTCCLFVRRAVFENVGLFDHRLVSGGDKEFGQRVAAAGYELRYAEDVTAYHPVRGSLRELVRKDLRVGRGHCQLQRYYPERYGRPGVPPHPSGVKSPSGFTDGLSLGDQTAFSSLSTFLTGVRAVGYASELVDPTHTGAEETVDDTPRLTD